MLLELLQLADSALPIGCASHSFGLETLIESEVLTPDNLEAFLTNHLGESGRLEAAYVRRAHREENLILLSAECDARRPARESREASLKLGRRFTDLFNELSDSDLPRNIHHCVAFGAAEIITVPDARRKLPEDPL